ncbi:vigilin [Cimex lectularius]|uniref:K Homology domain-containing protein n=1 Tax=Cimex lectularius TaxID=79782 RepID=A0A8I6RAL9_CIMLE|nr:vigilin [Cimex lectularius]XP_014242167.1 vigilin [Cimex lectularius]XP_014242168.1 vigilin [Cimex lectularius]
MEEGQVYHSNTQSDQSQYVYDEAFPALPESANPTPINNIGQWNNKMRIRSSVITQVFLVPSDERRFDHNNSFGEKESLRTCSAIMKETGALIEISSCKDGSLTFLLTGKQESVMDARRKILTTFQTQASSKISIPKEHHRCILGKSGNRLKELEKITATKISVPVISDNSDEITVTGTRDGIEKAIHEMQLISDEQLKKAIERFTIPKVYHPFICGAFNENVNRIQAETGVKIHIPPEGHSAQEITIFGEKEGVLAAKEEILSMYHDMEAKYTTVGVEVNKLRHKYVIGSKRSGIAEILHATGVSVEMPPPDSQKETITLRGPQDKLGSALNMVYAKANSMQSAVVDAPSWIHKYIIGRKGANIRSITQDFSKVHVQFTDKENKITIEGPQEEVSQAFTKLKELTSELESKLAYTELTVDQKYYKHIIGKNGANVNRLKEQTGVFINIADKDENVIRIEGDKEGVAAAKHELEEMIQKMEQEKERDIIIEWKHHKALIGNKGESIRDTKEKFSSVMITFPPPEKKCDIVKLRGPKADVDKCYEYLLKKVDEIVESSFTLKVPANGCHKFIIGKGGATIKKLREETNTTIEMTNDGGKDIITIIGKKENVHKAKDMIIKIQSEQLNNVTEEISIHPKIYNSLIGAGGKIIKSITDECGGVSIKFPSSDSKSDTVVLRGSKDDVKKAKKSLLEQASERELNSYTAEVRAKNQHHKFLIGKAGANINKIRESTGTKIIFPSDRDQDNEVITIMGKQEGVEEAKAALEAAIEKLNNVTDSEMTIDIRHHKHFVAKRCEVLHQLESEFEGVTISFPRNGVESNVVLIKGPKNMIEPVKKKMADIVHDLEERVTIDCVIPHANHRSIMGQKGMKVQEIEMMYNVKIKFPDRNIRPPDETHEHAEGESAMVNGDGYPNPLDVIKIRGLPENCEKAKQALKDSEPVDYEMDVPAEYHKAIIGPKGKNIKSIGSDYDVYIEVPGQDQQEEFIRIRGVPSAIEEAKLKILEEMKRFDEEKEDRRLKSFKISLEVDPEFHPKIIGKKGSVISKIRKNHGVQINFPNRDEPEENLITIQGYEENVNAARDEIMAIVNGIKEKTKEEFDIDSRVHSRLIGSRGRAIKKIMNKFNVEIRFPTAGSPNPNLICVRGEEDDVFNAKEHLLNLEEEYLQDISENEAKESRNAAWRGSDFTNNSGSGNATSGNGFVVMGGPWEHNQQQAPDTASTQEFPSFGTSVSSVTPTPSWGPRK